MALAGGGGDDPFDNNTAAPRDGRLNQQMCPDCGAMLAFSQLSTHRGKKRCVAQQKRNQLDRDYPATCPTCALALGAGNGENRRRHIESFKPCAPAKKRKGAALPPPATKKITGFFKRPAPAPAAAAPPAPEPILPEPPTPPAPDDDNEAFGGIPEFFDDSEFVSPGAAGQLETIDVNMAGGDSAAGVGAPDAGSVATGIADTTPMDSTPAGTPVDDSALTVQGYVTHASHQPGPTPTSNPSTPLHTLAASATNATAKFCSGYYAPPGTLGGERGFFQQIPWMKYDELPFTICGNKWHAHECAQRNFVLADGKVDANSATREAALANATYGYGCCGSRSWGRQRRRRG